MSSHQNQTLDLELVKSKFKKYKGGCLKLEKNDDSGIALMCLNSPGRRNSFSGEMMVQMSDLLTELEKWQKGKAVIIYGADGFFCSGGDMHTVKDIANEKDGEAMCALMQDNLMRLQSLPIISVALIEGRAIGGGAELITAFDFRLITSSAKIGFVHIKLGICAGWGGGSRLVQIVGPTKALELFTSGRQLSAQQALEIGLVNGILYNSKDEKDTLSKAQSWLSDYTFGTIEAIRANKLVINSARLTQLQGSLSKELKIFSKVWGAPAHKKALSLNLKHR